MTAMYWLLKNAKPRRTPRPDHCDGRGRHDEFQGFPPGAGGRSTGHVVIYPILVMPITNDAGAISAARMRLRRSPAGTGGLVFKPDLGAALDNAFNDILSALRTQYLLGYYPKDVPLTKNRFHQLRVTVDRPALQIITRTGYYGDSEDTPHKR